MEMHGFSNIIYMFVGLTIAIVLVANGVMSTIASTDTTDWDPASKAMWSIIPIVVIASLLLLILK